MDLGKFQDTPSRLSKRRAVLLSGFVALIFLVYSVWLFQVQIVDGAYYAEKVGVTTTSTELTIPATRGEILDRYYQALAVNKTAYGLILDPMAFPRGTSDAVRAEQNPLLLQLTALLAENGEQWSDTLPLQTEAPYGFSGSESAITTLKKTLGLASYATAENCMQAMTERYGLQEYDAATRRLLAGIQYSMEIQGFHLRLPYPFASGVSMQTAATVMENDTVYQGVVVQSSSVREYVNGDVASHLIGLVGPIYAEEYAELKNQGYHLNDTLGKSGIEAALEKELRGTSGIRTIVRDGDGNVIDDSETSPASAGNTVVLTLDAKLQAAAQQALADRIALLRAKKPTAKDPWVGQDVKSGSVVLLDVSDGAVLTCATWPNYSLATYSKDYAELVANKDRPLFNRALLGTFANGSTMKPALTVAALTEGIITRDSKPVFCDGKYHYYESSGYAPRCMGHHGNLNVLTALQKSCNVFYYDIGRLLGIDRMNSYCTAFGLGQKTGLELNEATGVLAGPEARLSSGLGWSAGDTIAAAIGQADNRFTPIQLAAYAMTLANDGVRYATHLVDSVYRYDGELLYEKKAEVLSRLTISEEVAAIVREGMVKVVKTGGTAANAFKGADYTLAAKTGTAQVGAPNTQSDHGVFIAYAPAENPQVAIAVVMENGTSGAAAAVARVVLDAYFNNSNDTTVEQYPGTLLP